MKACFLPFLRLRHFFFLPLLCLCCVLFAGTPVRAAETTATTIADYGELAGHTTPGDGVNWLNGAYGIYYLTPGTGSGGGAGYTGNLGLSGEELTIVQIPYPLSQTQAPLYIDSGSFYQTGGELKIIPVSTGSTQPGMHLKKGDYNLSGGKFTIIDVLGTALQLEEGNFNLSGGEIFALALSDKNVIQMDRGNFVMTGGRLVSIGANQTDNTRSSGAWLSNGSFSMSGGELVAKGTNGYGVHVSEDFLFSGGSIEAEVVNGAGIYLEYGRYRQTGGTLWLSPTAATNSYAVYVRNGGGALSQPWATFGSGAEVGTRLDLRDGAATVVNEAAGHFFVLTGHIAIEQGASLNLWVDYSLGLAKGTKTGDMAFLTALNDTIIGQFDSPADTLTLRFNYGTSGTTPAGGQYHSLSVERTARVSEVLQSRNARAVAAMEANAAWLLADANLGHALNTAYTLMDLSRSPSEMNRKARGLTPWGATALSRQAVSRMDMAQGALSNVLRAGNAPAPGMAAALAQPAAPETFATASGPAASWQAWVTPLARYDQYDAKSSASADTDGWSAGAAAGFARRFEGGTLGIGLHFLHGRQEGGGYTADSDTTGVMAGFRTNPLLSGAFSPWLEIGAGFAYSDVEQKRNDFFGHQHDSDLDQYTARLALSLGQDILLTDSFRLTPIIGFDYTWTKQDSFRENAPSGNAEARSMNLAVGDEEMQSYRPKIGGEAEWQVLDNFSLTAHAFYRYELGDRQAELSARYIGAPVRFTAKGERYDRSSGNVGAGFSWQATDAVSLGMLYDLTFGDHYQGHQFDLTLRYEF